MPQPQGKVAKYLENTKRDLQTETLEEAKAVGGGTVQAQPIRVDETLFQNSLTPTNVLKKIHQDIVRVIGIRPGIEGRFTPLEKRMVQSVEKVVRKGYCPSLLYRDPELRHALECLQRFYESATVQIGDAPKGSETIAVFASLIQYAREAADLEKQIKDLRAQVGKQVDASRKQALRNRIDLLKAKKDHCLIMYQKILFSDAEALQAKRKQRLLSLFGKHCTLDDLLAFFKKGGSLGNQETSQQEVDDAGLGDPYAEKPPSFEGDPDYLPPLKSGVIEDTGSTGYNLNFPEDPPEKDDLSITFDESNDEVVDWNQIKRQNRPGKT